MSDKITNALNTHFQTYRLIFWYDDGGKMEDVFTEYSVPDNGLKLTIENNEFHLRHQLLKDDTESKALLYSRSAKPTDDDNWLLDLQLSHFLFASDQAALVQQDLELADTFLPLIQEYQTFFANRKERLRPLQAMVNPETESHESLKLAMIAVLCRVNRKDLAEVTLNVLLDSAFSKSRPLWTELEKFGLQSVLVSLWSSEFGYHYDDPTPVSFLNYLLNEVLTHQKGENTSPLSGRLYGMLDAWRKNQDYRDQVQDLLDEAEKTFNVDHELSKVSRLSDLVMVDLYKEADRKIFSRILRGLLDDSIGYAEALSIIEARRETYWYKSGGSEKLVRHYQVLQYFLEYQIRQERFRPDFTSLDEGWARYTREYCLLDGDYRRFLAAVQDSDKPSNFADLLSKLDGLYTETYLQPLAEAWQSLLAADPSLSGLSTSKMKSFFVSRVYPYLNQNKTLFLIISDGFRYDLARELQDELVNQRGFQIDLQSLVAPTPAYTQLGMASLLPHRELTIAEDGNLVSADGLSTAGWENRKKVIETWIEKNIPGKTVRVIKEDKFNDMPRAEQREFVKGIDLVLIHSEDVDAIGDKAPTESQLPKAASNEIRKIRNLCETITRSLGRTNILVTADHGFLYRYREVPEADRTKLDTNPKEVSRDHRYLFTPEPQDHPAMDTLESDQVTWTAPFRVQVAKGVNRIRRPGGGTRYVHGGRMPQEICVPLMVIQYNRADDVKPVDIAVLDAQKRITSGQLTVSFLQEEPVEAKRPDHEIEAVFLAPDGTEISNSKRLIFDSTDPNNQNRSRKEQFIFNREADRCNGQMVSLELKTIGPGGVPVHYRSYSYQFQKQLGIEVDF